MNELNILHAIIQGGAVGISVLVIIVLGLVIKWFVKLVGNHINHNTEVLSQLHSVIEKNTISTSSNIRIMERVERVLDKNNNK